MIVVSSSQKKLRVFAASAMLLALVAVAGCLAALHGSTRGLIVETADIEGIPATIYRRSDVIHAPVVVVAHGFAGSQQMMQPLAATLGRSGYVVVTFDFAGHGRNAAPLLGGLKSLETSTRRLLQDVGAVVAFARAFPEGDGRVALVGHSMASELVVQYAMENKGVDAVVALSLFGRAVTADNPRNLIVIDGAWEPAFLRDSARRIVAEVAGSEPRERETYGDFAQGDARRYVYAAGAEHIGVIYSKEGIEAARDWLNAAFGRTDSAPADRRGAWIGGLCLAIVALLRALSPVLPRLADQRPPARRPLVLFAILLAAAVLTPVALAFVPTDFLPILLGDYLAAHFALYGVLLWLGLWFTRDRGAAEFGGVRPAVVATGLAAGVVVIVAFGLPLDAYVTSFWPTGLRPLLIPVEFAAVLATFSAEARLSRGAGAPRFALVGCKLMFLVSLAAAIALSPQRLFFLIIVTPVVAVLFVLFGLIDRWCARRTNAPLVGALATSLLLAWAISTTFPLVG